MKLFHVIKNTWQHEQSNKLGIILRCLFGLPMFLLGVLIFSVYTLLIYNLSVIMVSADRLLPDSIKGRDKHEDYPFWDQVEVTYSKVKPGG